MQGFKENEAGSSSSPDTARPGDKSFNLFSYSEDMNIGPIYMKMIELPPDTILFQELERSSDKVILTGSLSIIQQEMQGDDHGDVPRQQQNQKQQQQQLVQISHELCYNNHTDIANNYVIKGHQVWRFTKQSTFGI